MVGHEGHAISQKLLNTQHGVGRCARKLLVMKVANALKKSFTEAKGSLSQHHQQAH